MSAAPVMAYRHRTAEELDMLVAEVARLIEASIVEALIRKLYRSEHCPMTVKVRDVAIERARNCVTAASVLCDEAEIAIAVADCLEKARRPLYGNAPLHNQLRLTDRIVAVFMRGA